jgi:hypothetical protein
LEKYPALSPAFLNIVTVSAHFPAYAALAVSIKPAAKAQARVFITMTEPS